MEKIATANRANDANFYGTKNADCSNLNLTPPIIMNARSLIVGFLLVIGLAVPASASVLVTFSGITTSIGNGSLPMATGSFSGTIKFESGGVQTVSDTNQITGYYFSDTVASFTVDLYSVDNLTSGTYNSQSTIFFNRGPGSDRFISQIGVSGMVFGFVVDFRDDAFGPLAPVSVLKLAELNFNDILDSEISFLRSGTSNPNFGRLTSFSAVAIPEPSAFSLFAIGISAIMLSRPRFEKLNKTLYPTAGNAPV